MDGAHDGSPPQPHDADAAQPPSLVVGIGASAGGIRALQELFAHVPEESGAAWVVIVHLSPGHESRLAEVLQPEAPVPVSQVRERVRMERDHVYVIPPNRSLKVEGSDLVVSEVGAPEQRRAPIDVFFRTLADGRGADAACVVLSGTGRDGSTGLKRVKEHGGLTIAQDPDEAEYDDMPRSAIATGLVDYVLPIASIPAKILSYHRRLRRRAREAPFDGAPPDAERLREVLALLRARTGHDFSNYKPATVHRRIARRMTVHQVGTMGEYAAFMREHPAEASALTKELLISVTSFFRDAAAFAVLEARVVPRLFENRTGQGQVRVWVAGCATGEEAYSIAMLLDECAAKSVDAPAIQVFASDLDAEAIAVARDGLYTEAEVADVPEERLQRYFVREAHGFRVRRAFRELVLFAHHNAVRDPPFSHLDLVTCRNLMIYLNRAAQERLLETFHFALRPGGYLFLGTSESAEGSRDLFTLVDTDAHIYQSRMVASRPGLPLLEPTLPRAPAASRPAETRSGERISPADLHRRLLEEYAPPSIVVTEDHYLVHVSERAGRYLQVAGGEPTRDLFRMIRPELRGEIRTALHQAARQRAAVAIQAVHAVEGGDTPLRITVRPVLREGDPARGYFLIVFAEDAAPLAGAAPAVLLPGAAGPLEPHFDEELARVREHLRTTVEQYETQVEEAKAANEELQAMNEELRSSAEELETSKEELQSVNEELSTVNQELNIKVEELRLANNDFQNLINSTGIATIFLDRAFRVKLATPRASDVFNLLPSDIGRPLADITHRLIYPELHDDVREVLDRLQAIERELPARNGRWYLTRVMPYRTSDDRIDGVVLMFDDISGRRAAEDRLRASEERLRMLIESAVDYAIFALAPDGTVDMWNAGAERLFGYSAPEITGRPFDVLFTPEDRAAGVPAGELERARRDGRAEDERWHLRKDGTRMYGSGVTRRMAGNPHAGFVKIARDLTSERKASADLQEARDSLEERVLQRTGELRAQIAERRRAEEHALGLLRKLVTAQEDERTRIARDLHDQLGQRLTALRLALERHRERRPPDASADGDLDRALELSRDADAEIDFLAWELRPAVLDDLGLAEALPRYVDEWSRHYGIAAECRAAGVLTGALTPEAEVACYRVAQEALNNVIKHAHATRADVILEVRDNHVVLVVEDDGVGFDPAAIAGGENGIGLAGMKERAAIIGATLQVESAPGRGAAIFLRVPSRRR